MSITTAFFLIIKEEKKTFEYQETINLYNENVSNKNKCFETKIQSDW